MKTLEDKAFERIYRKYLTVPRRVKEGILKVRNYIRQLKKTKIVTTKNF